MTTSLTDPGPPPLVPASPPPTLSPVGRTVIRVLLILAAATLVLGIVALCQPLNLTLHRYGVAIVLLGLIGFNIFSKIKPPTSQDS